MKVLVTFVTLITVGHLMPGKYYLVETDDNDGNTNTKARNRKASGKCIGPDCDLQYSDTGELIGCRGIHAVCHIDTNANVRNRKATTNTNTKARNRKASGKCIGPDCELGYNDKGELISCRGIHAVCRIGADANNVRNRKAVKGKIEPSSNVAHHANIICGDGATCEGRNGEAELKCEGPDCIIGYSDSGENIECAGEHAVCGAERKAGGYQTPVCVFSRYEGMNKCIFFKMKSSCVRALIARIPASP